MSGVERVFLALLSGTLGVVVGLMLLGNPIQGGITLTVLLASFLFVGGIFKAVAALATSLAAGAGCCSAARLTSSSA